VVYEIMWKNTVEPDRPKVAMSLMSVACWIHKGTYTHSEYIILIALSMYGPKYENGEWKILTNRELEEMSKGENTSKVK